ASGDRFHTTRYFCKSRRGRIGKDHVVPSERDTRGLRPFSEWHRIQCDASAVCYFRWNGDTRGSFRDTVSVRVVSSVRGWWPSQSNRWAQRFASRPRRPCPGWQCRRTSDSCFTGA
ncbi:hypothetical protein ACJX0J_031723, partial [Zea mays]